MSKIEYKRFFPNLFTFASLGCGFIAVVSGSKDHYSEVITALFLVSLAALFDAMDGIMARLTNTSSKFGIELDSLADVVSFGFVPAFLAYRLYLKNFEVMGLLIATCFLFAGAFRLARFNTNLTGYSKSSFTGLPIPAAAITLTSFFITGLQEAPFVAERDPLKNGFGLATIPLVILLSILMVSKISYPVLPKPTFSEIKNNPVLFLLLFTGLILAFLTEGKSIFYFMLFFILQGIVVNLFKVFSPKENTANNFH